jgi:hypothetical protein
LQTCRLVQDGRRRAGDEWRDIVARARLARQVRFQFGGLGGSQRRTAGTAATLRYLLGANSNMLGLLTAEAGKAELAVEAKETATPGDCESKPVWEGQWIKASTKQYLIYFFITFKVFRVSRSMYVHHLKQNSNYKPSVPQREEPFHTSKAGVILPTRLRHSIPPHMIDARQKPVQVSVHYKSLPSVA